MHELLASTNKQASLQMPFGYLNCDIFLVFHMYLQFGDGMKPGCHGDRDRDQDGTGTGKFIMSGITLLADKQLTISCCMEPVN